MADTIARKRSASVDPADLFGSEKSEDEDEDLRALIEHTYASAWKSFRKWEKHYNHNILASLCDMAEETRHPEQSTNIARPNEFKALGDLDAEPFDYAFFKNHRTGENKTVMSHSHKEICLGASGFPSYESCTKTNRNIGPQRFDFHKDETCPFIPYSDDPYFYQEYYVSTFDFLGYLSEEDRNSDCERHYYIT